MQKIITKDNYDIYRGEAERLHNAGMSNGDIAKKIAISLDYVGRMLNFETYEEFRAFFNEKAKERYYKNKQKKAENKKAKDWSKDNKYVFGQKVTVLENTNTKKETKFTDNVAELAWKLVGKYSDDQDVRALLEAVILKKNRS